MFTRQMNAITFMMSLFPFAASFAAFFPFVISMLSFGINIRSRIGRVGERIISVPVT
jgi:hypothetical protein